LIIIGPTNCFANDELLAQLKENEKVQEEKFMFKMSKRR
jgi:hypothetical protein